jgi:hypothetical protein
MAEGGSKASAISSPPSLLRLLPAGAVAGWDLHPLEKRRLFTAHTRSRHRPAAELQASSDNSSSRNGVQPTPFTKACIGLWAAISAQELSCGSGHDAPAAEIDAGGGEGAVRLLSRGTGRDSGTGFKLASVGDLQTLNRHARSDDELLLAVLEFHREDGAVHTGYGLADRAIRSWCRWERLATPADGRRHCRACCRGRLWDGQIRTV